MATIRVAAMSADERSSLALAISISFSIAVLVRAITLFVSAEELILYAYVGSVVGVLVTLYELPAIVAYNKDHPRCLAILLVNILAGWTIVGWVIALVWAFAGTHPAEAVSTRVRLPVRTRLASSLSFRYERVFVSKQYV